MDTEPFITVSFLLAYDIGYYIVLRMKTRTKAQRLLERIAQIQEMERGKICRMTGRDHFNHQTWDAGRNIVGYVQREDIDDLQQAIDGYALFTELTRQYADEIVRLTRIQRAKRSRTRSKKRKT